MITTSPSLADNKNWELPSWEDEDLTFVGLSHHAVLLHFEVGFFADCSVHKHSAKGGQRRCVLMKVNPWEECCNDVRRRVIAPLDE